MPFLKQLARHLELKSNSRNSILGILCEVPCTEIRRHYEHWIYRGALKSPLLAIAFSLSIAGVTSIASASLLKIQAAKSSVHFTFKQMEVPVQGEFKRFSATIDYDRLKPENAKAHIDIDLRSIELPAPEYNQEALKKEWFNASQFPLASFTSSSMKALAAGKLQVTGTLTIKGKTMPVSFPLNITNDTNNQVFEGALTIKRLHFNIGEGEWKDTSMLADEILIRFRITGTP